jgi:putative intracellular protease/amidase
MKLLSTCFTTAFAWALTISAIAQESAKPLAVGIFIYEGVEVLDFSGPAEVFAATPGFNTFTVAVTDQPIISQGFIKVTPQYSIENCPPTDILVFPGGGTRRLQDHPEFINWIQQRSENTQVMMSVCTGAALLSKAGLLDGKEVTTWHGFISRLQDMTPEALVLSDTRFVDNGHVVTTAGVSAGIDGALHVVSRIKGQDVAMATARYMEYDKWQPDAGKIIESPFIKSVRSNGLESALNQHPGTDGAVQPLYYIGEMRNLAFELLELNPTQSAAIFTWLLKTTTPAPTLYDGLGMAWQKLGKESPVPSTLFLEKLRSGDVAWARQTWTATTAKHPNWLLCTEAEVNVLAYQMMQSGRPQGAVEVFQWNTEANPESANAWDSLADGFEGNSDFVKAISASQKCLSILSHSEHQVPQAEALENASQERIERLKGNR